MTKIKIFFDESGKNSDTPHLMGALLFPDTIYSLPEFENMQTYIKYNNIHWKKYTGFSKHRIFITNLVKEFSKHASFIRMNIINYNQNEIRNTSNEYKKIDVGLANSTIYMKFPERLVYGLIRNYGKLSSLDVEIVIEEATEYKLPNVDLKNTLTKQLNVQSIYRGEKFKVVQSLYLPKHVELGLETTDLILGMARTIVTNPDLSMVGPNNNKRHQVKLILELLQIPQFYNFLENIKFYEWSGVDLKEANFKHYLQVFISSNYHEYLAEKLIKENISEIKESKKTRYKKKKYRKKSNLCRRAK